MAGVCMSGPPVPKIARPEYLRPWRFCLERGSTERLARFAPNKDAVTDGRDFEQGNRGVQSSTAELLVAITSGQQRARLPGDVAARVEIGRWRELICQLDRGLEGRMHGLGCRGAF